MVHIQPFASLRLLCRLEIVGDASPRALERLVFNPWTPAPTSLPVLDPPVYQIQDSISKLGPPDRHSWVVPASAWTLAMQFDNHASRKSSGILGCRVKSPSLKNSSSFNYHLQGC